MVSKNIVNMCQLRYDKKFICPICGSSQWPLLSVGSSFPVLEELKVIGAGNRLQKCHGCKGSDRDRLVYLYLRDYECLFDGTPHDKSHFPHCHSDSSFFNRIFRIATLTAAFLLPQ